MGPEQSALWRMVIRKEILGSSRQVRLEGLGKQERELVCMKECASGCVVTSFDASSLLFC